MNVVLIVPYNLVMQNEIWSRETIPFLWTKNYTTFFLHREKCSTFRVKFSILLFEILFTDKNKQKSMVKT